MSSKNECRYIPASQIAPVIAQVYISPIAETTCRSEETSSILMLKRWTACSPDWISVCFSCGKSGWQNNSFKSMQMSRNWESLQDVEIFWCLLQCKFYHKDWIKKEFVKLSVCLKVCYIFIVERTLCIKGNRRYNKKVAHKRKYFFVANIQQSNRCLDYK